MDTQSRYLTASERQSFLARDPMAIVLEDETYVHCRLCKSTIKSKASIAYDIFEWKAHADKCMETQKQNDEIYKHRRNTELFPKTSALNRKKKTQIHPSIDPARNRGERIRLEPSLGSPLTDWLTLPDMRTLTPRPAKPCFHSSTQELTSQLPAPDHFPSQSHTPTWPEVPGSILEPRASEYMDLVIERLPFHEHHHPQYTKAIPDPRLLEIAVVNGENDRRTIELRQHHPDSSFATPPISSSRDTSSRDAGSRLTRSVSSSTRATSSVAVHTDTLRHKNANSKDQRVHTTQVAQKQSNHSVNMSSLSCRYNPYRKPVLSSPLHTQYRCHVNNSPKILYPGVKTTSILPTASQSNLAPTMSHYAQSLSLKKDEPSPFVKDGFNYSLPDYLSPVTVRNTGKLEDVTTKLEKQH